jgi:hypothetical protein
MRIDDLPFRPGSADTLVCTSVTRRLVLAAILVVVLWCALAWVRS